MPEEMFMIKKRLQHPCNMALIPLERFLFVWGKPINQGEIMKSKQLKIVTALIWEGFSLRETPCICISF